MYPTKQVGYSLTYRKVDNMSNQFWNDYYKSLEGATILRFKGMMTDEFNPYDEGFPQFLVRFSDGKIGDIEISRDTEGNGGGFIFGLILPQN